MLITFSVITILHVVITLSIINLCIIGSRMDINFIIHQCIYWHSFCYHSIKIINDNFTTWVHVLDHAGLHVHMLVCGHLCLTASVCVHVCACEYAATLHGNSIPRLWLSTGLSLAVTSHHLPVSETAEQRAAYEQWGDGGSPSAEWQTLALSDCTLLGPPLSSWGVWPSSGI